MIACIKGWFKSNAKQLKKSEEEADNERRLKRIYEDWLEDIAKKSENCKSPKIADIYKALTDYVVFTEEMRARWLGIYIALLTGLAALVALALKDDSGFSFIVPFILLALSFVSFFILLSTIGYKRSHDAHARILRAMDNLPHELTLNAIHKYRRGPWVFKNFARTFAVFSSATASLAFYLIIRDNDYYKLLIESINMTVVTVVIIFAVTVYVFLEFWINYWHKKR